MYVDTNPSGQEIGFAVARRNERLRLVFERTGLKKKIGDANLFPTIETAAAAFTLRLRRRM